MFLPILILAAVAGLVFYEKSKSVPPPLPGRCVPATTLLHGHLYKFGCPLPVGAPAATAAMATQLAQSLIASGKFGPDTQAWVRGDVSAVAFGWPPDAADNAIVVRGTYVGGGEPLPALFVGSTDCGPATSALSVGETLAFEGQGLSAVFAPPSQHHPGSAQAGYYGGVWGEDRMGQASPSPSPLSPSSSSDCECVTPDQVMEICVLILAQAIQGGSMGMPGGHAAPALPQPAPQMPQLQPQPQPQPQSPAGASGPVQVGRASKMRKGQGYFVSYPAASQLSSILWQPATVADAPASPTPMVADPTQNVNLPTQSIPKSAPGPWLSHFGPGRAIAVLTWIGPDNGADPGVSVWGTYTAGQDPRQDPRQAPSHPRAA